MQQRDHRRNFIRQGSAAAFGVLAAGSSIAHGQDQGGLRPDDEDHVDRSSDAVSDTQRQPPDEFATFSRWYPSFGGTPDSDEYLGKLVPGLRRSGLEPVPVVAPDLHKVPWRMVEGRKEYDIYCEPVRREILPGKWMNFFGYNGTMPGPTIEATQGDRVRFVVHNRLPEPTTIHWHGVELPVEEDGVPGVTQDAIPPGQTFVYEYDLHQTGTFFYHSHMPMQGAFGMVGFLIIHPKIAWDPVVDRDFLLVFQNFVIRPNNTVPDSFFHEFNWHTINGRSGPYTTPLVVKHGERVRIRIMDFSPQQHHPIHLHGHTFWVTGHEGARLPTASWQCRNNELIAVAQASDLEFIAFNPGDWLMHCHMVHHMMNHMVVHAGPRIRQGVDVASYKRSLEERPRVKFPHTDAGFAVPGYPQMMQGQSFTTKELEKINSRRETRGMRHNWHKGVKGLMLVVRVLPEDLYDRVMNSDEPIEPGAVFNEIARRRGDNRPGERQRRQPLTDG